MKSKLILCSSLVLVGAIDVRAMNDVFSRGSAIGRRNNSQLQTEYSSESDNKSQPLKSPYSTDNKAIPIQQTKQNNFSDDNNEYDYYSKSAQNSDFELIQKDNQKIDEEEEEFEYNKSTSNDQHFNDENKQNQSSDKEYDNFNDSINSTQNRKDNLINQEEAKSQSEKDDNQYSDNEDQNSYKERDNFNDSRNSTRSKKAESFRRSIPLAVNDEFGQNEYSDHYDNFNDSINSIQNRKDNLINQEEAKSQSEKDDNQYSDNEDQNSYKERDNFNDSRNSTRSKKAESFRRSIPLAVNDEFGQNEYSDHEDQNSYKERDNFNDSKSSTRSKKAKSLSDKDEQEEIELSKNNKNHSDDNISQECDLPVTEAHWYDKPVAWIKSSWNYCYYSWPVQRYVVRPFKSAVKEFSSWLLGDDIVKEAEKKAGEKIAGRAKMLYEQIREIAAGQQQDQQEMSEVEDDVDAQLDAVSRQLSLVRKRDVNELLGRVEDLEQNIENEKRGLSDKSFQLDQKVNEFENKFNELSSDLVEKQKIIERKEQEYNNHTNSIIENAFTEQRKKLRSMDKWQEQIKQELDTKGQEISRCEEQIQQINTSNRCLKHEVKKLKEQQVDCHVLLQRVNELTSSLNQTISAFNTLKSFATETREKLNVLSSSFEGADDFSILDLVQRIENIEQQMQDLTEGQRLITLEDPQTQALGESAQKRSAEIEHEDENNEPQLLNLQDLASEISSVDTSDLSMNSSAARKSSKKHGSSNRQKNENDFEQDDPELASLENSKNQKKRSTLSKNAQFNENEKQQGEQRRRKRRHNKNNKDQETDNENGINQYDSNIVDN